VLHVKDDSVMMCDICLGRCHGKPGREKCHRKQQRASCDCAICIDQREATTADAPRTETEERPKSKRQRACVDYSQSVLSKSADDFFIGKGKLGADANADARKAKYQRAEREASKQQASEEKNLQRQRGKIENSSCTSVIFLSW
jgi:hypothetical protein